MSKQMKFIVFLFLFIFSDVYALKLNSQAHRFTRVSKSKALTYLKQADNPLIKAFKEKFNSLGAQLEQSKFFNFLAGAGIKAFSLLEGNEIGDILKCVVTSIEVFWNSVKFPEKSLEEVKALSTGLDDTATGNALTTAESDDGTDDKTVVDGMKEGQKSTYEVECATTTSLMEDEGGLDYVDEIGTEEPITLAGMRFSQVEGQKLPKFFKKLKAKFASLKNKFEGLVNKFREKLAKLENVVKKWLAKPIVKSLINFFECSLPSILTLILKGGASFAGMFSGISLINVIKQGPKFLKMIIDGIKSIRNGFTKKTIKEKYLEYGKGTASFIMIIFLTAMPS